MAGYAGGEAATAQYEIVSTGATGHAESVEITYDPAKISFESLLDVYFKVAHDPTELNRQGPDEGTQYRSEIFYTTGEQRTQALDTIAHLEQTHAYSSRIVTVVAPLTRLLSGGGLPPRFRACTIRRTRTSSSTTCRNSRSYARIFLS